MDEQETSFTEDTPDYTEYTQLSQVRVPLEDAAFAFTSRDENGKLPVIIIPTQLMRIRMELVVLAVGILIGGILLAFLLNAPVFAVVAIILAPVLIIIAIYRAFMVRIPEGSKALLTRGGRYIRTIEPGFHIVPPYIIVSHLITQREIPFAVPLIGVPTSDNVRANVDVLLTFRVRDPYQLVFNISAVDFDQVLQAVCQDTMRAFIRTITSYQVMDLVDANVSVILEPLNEDMANYGVEIVKTKITFAQPPAEFMRSQEARQLAVLQQAEQQEVQALAIRRQKDVDALARQRVVAQVERDKEALQIAIQKAEARRRLEELEAENEALRLAHKQERITKYPDAWEWEMKQAHLDIARALASNTRAVLQIGEANDIIRAFLVRDALQNTEASQPEAEAPQPGAEAPKLGAEELPPQPETKE